MVMNGTKLGEILLDADIITKRQLAQAVQKQVKGDKRKIGEILVEMGYVTVADLTEVMMEQASKATDEVEKGKRDRLLQKQISKSKNKSKLVPIVEKVVAKPVELSEEKILSTKFTLSIQTIVTAAAGIASLVGMYYMLLGEIELAKQLPKPLPMGDIYSEEYPSRPDGHNWPSSKEQYKQQVGQLGRDVDEAIVDIEKLEEKLEKLENIITELRVQVANKRDK